MRKDLANALPILDCMIGEEDMSAAIDKIVGDGQLKIDEKIEGMTTVIAYLCIYLGIPMNTVLNHVKEDVCYATSERN